MQAVDQEVRRQLRQLPVEPSVARLLKREVTSDQAAGLSLCDSMRAWVSAYCGE